MLPLEAKRQTGPDLRQARCSIAILHHGVPVTYVVERPELQDRYEQAIAQHRRRKHMLAVTFLDLDGFKVINDTYGHEAGDRLLIELATRMKRALRDGDTLARLGGDEFVAIMTDLSARKDATVILKRLLVACSDPVPLMGVEVQVSASIGVTFAPEQGSDLDMLLRKADQAMYLAKQSGRNQFRFSDECAGPMGGDLRPAAKMT